MPRLLASSVPLLLRPETTLSEFRVWHRALQRHFVSSSSTYLVHCLLSMRTLARAAAISQPLSSSVAVIQHHIAASNLFRTEAPIPNADNWEAVMAFGLCTLMVQFAIQQDCEDGTFDYMETLRTLRSSDVIGRMIFPFLSKSEGFRFISPRHTTPVGSVEAELDIELSRLETMIREQEPSQPIRHALNALRAWANDCGGTPRIWRHYLLWPAMVTEEYLLLLEADDDLAILIFVYWCALFHRAPQKWYMVRWPRRAALVGMSRLSRDWSDALLWPMMVLDKASRQEPCPIMASLFVERSLVERYALPATVVASP